jgi:hypothetical protein
MARHEIALFDLPPSSSRLGTKPSPTSICRSPGFGWVPPFLLNKACKCR